jgi:hypothetical protein
MLQPDAVYVLKTGGIAAYSVTFLNQQLQVGKKNGNIAVYCLSVSVFFLYVVHSYIFCVLSYFIWPNSLFSHCVPIMN